jgi:hypothetical protein
MALVRRVCLDQQQFASFLDAKGFSEQRLAIQIRRFDLPGFYTLVMPVLVWVGWADGSTGGYTTTCRDISMSGVACQIIKPFCCIMVSSLNIFWRRRGAKVDYFMGGSYFAQGATKIGDADAGLDSAMRNPDSSENNGGDQHIPPAGSGHLLYRKVFTLPVACSCTYPRLFSPSSAKAFSILRVPIHKSGFVTLS